MKYFLFLLTMGGILSVPVQAQVQRVSLVSNVPDETNPSPLFSKYPIGKNTDDQSKYQKYKRMQSAGTILTIAGPILFVPGLIIARRATRHNYTKHDFDTNVDNTANLIGGTILWAVGAAATGGGITMWAIGSKKKKKYSNSVAVELTPTGTGIAYRF